MEDNSQLNDELEKRVKAAENFIYSHGRDKESEKILCQLLKSTNPRLKFMAYTLLKDYSAHLTHETKLAMQELRDNPEEFAPLLKIHEEVSAALKKIVL